MSFGYLLLKGFERGKEAGEKQTEGGRRSRWMMGKKDLLAELTLYFSKIRSNKRYQ